MTKPPRTPEQKIAELELRAAQVKARIQKERAKLQGAERKRDTRRKIIAGALALEHAPTDKAFNDTLQRLLGEYVTRAEDRELFGLPPVVAS